MRNRDYNEKQDRDQKQLRDQNLNVKEMGIDSKIKQYKSFMQIGIVIGSGIKIKRGKIENFRTIPELKTIVGPGVSTIKNVIGIKIENNAETRIEAGMT
ncbi:hypothetical protein EVAR_46625_1 [Eumeta japonica]|uniref:Uncharacterized protein n=1 Tax=Eumeta variegata TaxID=151549 RepID=A0A4C1WFZ5_EUMVA|nr:hypothetical protein EVAR_46625_1 [Eumeta japonica]